MNPPVQLVCRPPDMSMSVEEELVFIDETTEPVEANGKLFDKVTPGSGVYAATVMPSAASDWIELIAPPPGAELDGFRLTNSGYYQKVNFILRRGSAGLNGSCRIGTLPSGFVTYVFKGHAPGTIGYDMTEDLRPLGGQAAPDCNYYANHAAGNYARNPACWAESLDFSALSVANNQSGTWRGERAGVLITPRHVIMAKHYPVGVGKILRFVSAAGVMQTVSVLALASNTPSAGLGDDVVVGTLSEAVTVASPVELASNWLTEDSRSGSYYRYHNAYPTVHFDRYRRVFIGNFGATSFNARNCLRLLTAGSEELLIDVSGVSVVNLDPDFASYYIPHDPIGDSGSPVFLVIDGVPKLLGCYFWIINVGAGCENIGFINRLIAQADAAAGISTGLTASAYDVSAYAPAPAE